MKNLVLHLMKILINFELLSTFLRRVPAVHRHCQWKHHQKPLALCLLLKILAQLGNLSEDAPAEGPDFPCPDGDLDEEYEELENNNIEDNEPPKNKSSFYEMRKKLLQKI